MMMKRTRSCCCLCCFVATWTVVVFLSTLGLPTVQSFQSFSSVGATIEQFAVILPSSIPTPPVVDDVQQKIQKFKNFHCNERRYQRMYGNGDYSFWSLEESQQVSHFLTNKAKKQLRDFKIPRELWDGLLDENQDLVARFCKERRRSSSSTPPTTTTTEPPSSPPLIRRRLSLLLQRQRQHQQRRSTSTNEETSSSQQQRQRDIQDIIQAWKQEWCNVSNYRKRYSSSYKKHTKSRSTSPHDHSAVVTVDVGGGEWGPTETRSFYLNKLERGLFDLANLGIPIEYWGDLAFELRQTLKMFAREQSYFLWRLWAIAMSKGDELTLEERKEMIRSKLDTTKLSEHQVNIQVSLTLFDSASRTRQSVNHAIHMLSMIEAAAIKPRYMAYYMLPKTTTNPITTTTSTLRL